MAAAAHVRAVHQTTFKHAIMFDLQMALPRCLVLVTALILLVKSSDCAKLPDAANIPSVIPATFGRTSDYDIFKGKNEDELGLSFTNKGQATDDRFLLKQKSALSAESGRKKSSRRGNSGHRTIDPQQASTYGSAAYSKLPEYQTSYLSSYPRQSALEEAETKQDDQDYITKLKKFYERPDEYQQQQSPEKSIDYEQFLRYAYKHYGNQFPGYFKDLQETKRPQYAKASIQDILENGKPNKFPNFEQYQGQNSGKYDYLSALYDKEKPLELFDNPLGSDAEGGFSPSFVGKRKRPQNVRGYDNQSYFVEDSISVGRPQGGRPRNKNCSGSRCRKQVRPELGRNSINERRRRPIRRPRI